MPQLREWLLPWACAPSSSSYPSCRHQHRLLPSSCDASFWTFCCSCHLHRRQQTGTSWQPRVPSERKLIRVRKKKKKNKKSHKNSYLFGNCLLLLFSQRRPLVGRCGRRRRRRRSRSGSDSLLLLNLSRLDFRNETLFGPSGFNLMKK